MARKQLRIWVSADELERFQEMAPNFGLTFSEFFSFCASYGLKMFELVGNPSPAMLKLMGELDKFAEVEDGSSQLVEEFKERHARSAKRDKAKPKRK